MKIIIIQEARHLISLLLLLFATLSLMATTSATRAAANSDDGGPSAKDFLWSLLSDWDKDHSAESAHPVPREDGGDDEKPPHNAPPQQILVIGAGLPRTATSSLVLALRRLGLVSYHMRQGVVETRGHLTLWNDMLTKANNNGEETSLDDVFDQIAKSGFNATADAPTCFFYKEQMKRYPNARVVLTIRSDGSGVAWAHSVTNSIFRFTPLLKDVPFRFLSGPKTWLSVMTALSPHFGPDVNPETDLPEYSQLPGAYDRWVEEVQSYVPKDRLLVHAAKDGWKPLCEFLSPLSPQIASNCLSVLADGVPYPRVNETADIQRGQMILRSISIACKSVPILLILLVFWLLRKRLPKTKTD